MKTAVMNAEGRITVPVAARRALGVEGETPFEVEVRDGALVLRPAVVVPREDAWAYTPEHLRLVERARQDEEAGRILHLSSRDFEQGAR